MHASGSSRASARRGWAAGAALALIAHGASAAGIANGDFANGLDGWTAEGSSVSAAAGGGDFFALLEIDPAVASVCGGFSGDRCLYRSFTVSPSGGGTLSFDFSFSTVSTSGSGKDSLAVSLVSDDGSDPGLGIVAVDEALGVVTDNFGLGLSVGHAAGPLIDGFTAFATGTTRSGRITLALPSFVDGDTVTLYFDLFEGAAVNATRAGIDNVSIDALRLPEPGPMLLVLAGLLGVAPRVRGAS